MSYLVDDARVDRVIAKINTNDVLTGDQCIGLLMEAFPGMDRALAVALLRGAIASGAITPATKH